MQAIETELVDGGEKRDGRGRRRMPAQRRAELIEAYRASGLTAAEFARREGLKYQTFAGWVARSSGESQPSSPTRFARLSLPVAGASMSAALEVQLTDGTILRGREAGALAELARALRGLGSSGSRA